MNVNETIRLVLQHYQSGKLGQAEQLCQIILKKQPNDSEVLYFLGLIYAEQKNLDLAIQYIKRSLQFNSVNADAYFALGIAMQQKGLTEEAMSHFQKAINLNPNNSEAYNCMANSLEEKGQLDEAIANYQKALQLDPTNTNAYYRLGNTLKKYGKLDEAIVAYNTAIKYKSDYIAAYWARCMAQIPIIYPDESSIQISRERYYKELLNLREIIKLNNPQEIEAAAEAVGSHQPFFLAYQGLNDRELQQLYGDLVCKIMSLRYPQFANPLVMPPFSPEEPLRIGIVSRFFYLHSNWKLRIKGWIENINKQRFIFYGYYTGKIKDDQTAIARQNFYRFVEDINSFEELCETIRRDSLHVLICPEIGMDPVTLRLSALRLAPVQCTSWGHPETSGLPSIDYYLSSDLMEPSDAENYYSERLIRLPNLSVYYTPLNITQVEASRKSFGLRSNSILYFCGQSLFKYLPQYDDIFPRIAKEVRNCQFLFISNPSSNFITEQFRSRLSNIFNRFNMNVDDYVVFLEPLQPYEFYAINHLSDIFLDTIGWSGCNSTFEAITHNLPIVTLPGEFMRGRHSSAILTMMGVTETIASTTDEYIELAVRLGLDSEWRKQISDKTSANKHLVYRDKTCITALEDFLERVVKEKLK